MTAALRCSTVLLIDLGGVLADLGDPVASMRLPMSSRDFWRIWTTSSSVKDYEAGRIGLDQFAERMAAEFQVGDAAEFLRRLHSWRLSIFPGTHDVLQSVAESYRLAMLSNTNPVHWQQVLSSEPIASCFDKLFLSFETGKLKPDPDAFTQVLDYFACQPDELVFLDDSAIHLEGARRLGIRSEQVVGPEALRDTLARLGKAGDPGVDGKAGNRNGSAV